MLRKLINNSIRRPIATLVIFSGATLIGLVAALNLPLDIYPSVDFPRLFITTQWPGASPRTVESEVTSVIEGALASVRGIEKIRSFSRVGYSQIELQLHRSADIDYIVYEIQEKLSFLRERLPSSALPSKTSKYVPQEFQVTNFLSYHIAGPLTDAELREIALKHVKPVLSGVPGVAGIEVLGGREKQLQIVYDNEALEKWDLFPYDIYRAVGNAGFFTTLGEFVEANQRYCAVLSEKLVSPRDIETLPIVFIGQRCILLRDVANVVESFSPFYEIQKINGQPTVLINIIRESNTNVVRVADRVYKTIQTLERTLPPGVRLAKEDDQSVFVRDNIRQLVYRSVFSLCIIFLVLVLFLRYMRFTIVILLTVVISVLFTIFLMFVFHYSFNIITLAGLALGFGMLVDSAIVVFENIFRHWEQDYEATLGALRGTETIARPLIAATLTTIAALMPFLYLMEELSIYYSPFAVTVSSALVVSLLSAIFLVPTLAIRLRGKALKRSNREASEVDYALWNITFHLRRGYGVLLRGCLKHPWLTIAVVIWLFGIPVWLLPTRISVPRNESAPGRAARLAYNSIFDSRRVRRARSYIEHIVGGSTYLFYKHVDRHEIWRYPEQTYIQCSVSLPSGSPIEETNIIATSLESVLKGIKGIAQTRVTVHPTYAYLTVWLMSGADYAMAPFIVREKLISHAASIGNARIFVTGYGPAFASGGSGMASSNQLIITGYNYAEIERICDDIAQRLAQNVRVQNIRTDLSRGNQSSDITENSLRLDFSSLGEWHITSIDVHRQIQPYLSQYLYRQRIRFGDSEMPFTIFSRQYKDFDMYQVENLPIRNNLGQNATLHALASLQQKLIPTVIEREDQEYYRIVAFDYLGSNSAAQKYISSFVSSVHLPAGYSLQEPGDFFWKKGVERNISLVLLLALGLMYMVLAGLYESFSYPLLIFIIIPLSLIGVFLVYFLTGAAFNQSAYIGTILMAGIIVNNAIFLLDRVNELKVERRIGNLNDLLVQAGQDRLRPILMTTLTTIVGLLPFIISSERQNANDIWQTLSLSTMGGLAFGTFLGLLVLPVFVQLLERIQNRWRAVRIGIK